MAIGPVDIFINGISLQIIGSIALPLVAVVTVIGVSTALSSE
jgi:hypothetical protein